MKKYLFTVLICGLLTTGFSQSVTRLLGGANNSNVLYVLDTSSYNVVAFQNMSQIGGFNIDGITGMAKHPVTNTYYVVAKANGSRYLGTLNPSSASVTNVGDLGDFFSQITFNGNNTLYGITSGGQALVPNALFRINPATATNTYIVDMQNSYYGEVITYNPVDNNVYHWANYDDVYEKFDTTFYTPNPVLNPGGIGETAGGVYRSNGVFLICDVSSNLNLMSSSGAVINVGSAPATLKGMAYITCQRQITGTYTFCAGGSAATLTMSAGGATYQWYRNNVSVPGATLATLSTTVAGHYNCKIKDGCGTDSLATGVTVLSAPLPTVTVTGPNAVCALGQTITLTGTNGGTSQWYKNGVLLAGATSNTYGASSAGIYNMRKTNLNGCSDSAAVGKTVTITPGPTVNIAALSTTLCSGQSLTLTSSGANTYTWNTGPTTSSLAISPTVTTTYSVIGTSTTSGCATTKTITITVTLCNGLGTIAGKNSVFKISPNPTNGMINIEAEKEISSYELIDLTGKVIFQEKGISSSKFSLNLSSLDNSVYFMRVTLSGGEVLRSKIILDK